MSENQIIIIIAVVIGAVAIGVGGYFLARFMRGTIKIFLPKTAFNPDETIKGSFELHTKKYIQGNRLIVSLIAERITEYRKGDKTESRTDEIYRNEKLIEDATDYRAGFVKKYDFEIAVPNQSAPEMLNSPLVQSLAAAAALLGNHKTRIRWKLQTRLDAKGIDIVSTKKLSVNSVRL
jgi:hypothetical protein